MSYLYHCPVLLVSLLATVNPTSARAQVAVSIGPRMGYSLTTANYKIAFDGYSYTTGYRSGFEAGVQAAISLGHYAIQPAVLFSQRGYKLTEHYANPAYSYSDDSRIRTNYITIPLQLAYTQRTNGQGAQLFVGPYVGFLLGGHSEYAGTYTDAGGASLPLEGGSDVKANDYESTNPTDTNLYQRRVDGGLQAGVGYRQGNVLLQAAYSWGLRNISPASATSGAASPERALRNQAFQLAAAYLFGSKQ